jgi:S-layer protein
VTIIQAAEVTPVKSATAGVFGIINGGVTVTDGNAATASDTISTVTLANHGTTTITSSVLDTLNVTGGGAAGTASGAITINKSAADTSTAATTLTLTGSGHTGAIDGTLADVYTAVNINATSDLTIADVNFAAATGITASGAGVTTISALTDVGAVTTFTSTGGGLSLGAAIDNTATFVGGAGKDTVTLGATTKSIDMGAGDDTVTLGASLGTGGTVAGGDGIDTLKMTNAIAAANDAGSTFNGKVTGFETLTLTNALSGTIDVSALNNPSKVVLDVGGDNATTAILNNLQDNATVQLKEVAANAGVSAAISGAGANTANTINLTLTNATAATEAFNSFTANSVETINIAMNDTGKTTSTVATVDTLTLVADAAKSIVVTGNNGLTLTNTNTTITSFDSTGIAADKAEDTATLLAVSWTTGALAGASDIRTDVGNDVINASAAVKAVSMSTGAGTDALTGSATKASTLDGGAGNDGITGGAAADVIIGGDGTDTYTFSSAAVAEQAGSGTTDGTVINLGATALTSSAVFTLTGKYLSGAQTEVASGTSTYLFSNESSTNASITDSLSSIENVTGTASIDYIVGTGGANTIIGAAGADYITSGTGADTIEVAAIAVAGSVAGADTITDFTVGGGLEGDTIRLLDTAFTWAVGTTDGTVVLATGTDAAAAHAADGDATVLTISDDVAGHTVATYQAGTSSIADLEGAIATALGTTLTATMNAKHVVVAVDDGTDTMIVRYSDGGTNGAVVGELSLLAIIDGLADATTLTADNFAFA